MATGLTQPLAVRPATRDDAAFLRAIVPRLFAHKSGWRTHEELVEGTLRTLREVLAARREDELFVVAELAGSPLGFAYATTRFDFFTREPYVHLSEIVVAGDGAGAGRALMDAVEGWAFGRGVRYVALNVLDENLHAQGFYRHRGYETETHNMVKLRP